MDVSLRCTDSEGALPLLEQPKHQPFRHGAPMQTSPTAKNWTEDLYQLPGQIGPKKVQRLQILEIYRAARPNHSSILICSLVQPCVSAVNGLNICGARHYPVKFALRLLRVRQKLCSGLASQVCAPPGVDAKEVFSSNDFTDRWVDAKAPCCIRYLRGNRNLIIPDEWRELLPNEL